MRSPLSPRGGGKRDTRTDPLGRFPKTLKTCRRGICLGVARSTPPALGFGRALEAHRSSDGGGGGGTGGICEVTEPRGRTDADSVLDLAVGSGTMLSSSSMVSAAAKAISWRSLKSE
jgi:hypothetical protein